MDINTAKLIYFSPTGTTKKVLEGILQGIGIDATEHIDLTPSKAKALEVAEMQNELALIGVPVYGGRVPLDAIERFQQLNANDTPAVIIVLYGNREFEDALIELRDLATKAGFRPIAGGAFIGEHSLANDKFLIANGRPDEEDIKKAKEFGKMIREKLEDITKFDDMPLLQVSGDYPYKERVVRSGVSPVTQEDLCIKCGTCATVCPIAAINVGDTVLTDSDACIRCCACVKECPEEARIMTDPGVEKLAEWLATNCGKRKEPEIFIE